MTEQNAPMDEYDKQGSQRLRPKEGDTRSGTDEVTFLCPQCDQTTTILNPRALFLAHHLDNFCPETEGLLHP
jgi:hypothetical protein